MAKHKMNMNSSRSHTILTVRVQSFDNEDPKNILSSKLELVDLAGSERQSITGSTGKVFRQGIEINKSLFTLRQVISSLFEYNKNLKADSTRQPIDFHVPYRDSKLTSILKQSIGGNNYCVMVRNSLIVGSLPESRRRLHLVIRANPDVCQHGQLHFEHSNPKRRPQNARNKNAPPAAC